MIGKILGNRYEIVEKIGTGGMSVVYKAKCQLLNRYVAIKVLKQEFVDNEEFIKKFRVEAQAAASLSNSSIVSIYDVGNDNGYYYIVMEYVEGITLKEYISNKKQLEWKEAVNIAIQICSALETAHKNGIVHRDIKPANIIITSDGFAKVTDFGIARAATYFTVTLEGNAIGSVHYFSPEQARGGYTDNKSDIYSLGVVLYEMLTGEVPFDGDTPVAIAFKHVQQSPKSPIEINDLIPQSLNNVIIKAMTKSIDERYLSATDMLNDLKQVLENPESDIVTFPQQESNDDSPTLVMPSVNENDNDNSTEDNMKKNNKSKSKQNKKQKRDKLTLFSAIGTSLIIVAMLSFFGYKIIFSYTHTAQEVTVPDLIGKTLDQARLELSDSNLTLKVKDKRSNDKYKSGVIFKQSPTVGIPVKIPNDVEVVVSTGKKVVDIPILKYEDYRKAKVEIEALGLKPKIEYKSSESIPIGHVIRTLPAGGRTVDKDSNVKIFVSDGPDSEKFSMPNLINKTKQEAKKILDEKGLEVGNITYKESSEDYGKVLEQSVDADSKVSKGASIDITLSTGNPSNSNNEIQISVALPNDKKSVKVKLVLIDNNGMRKVVYPETLHKTSESPLTIKVTGEGKGRIQVYFDGVLDSEEQINFEEEA